MRQKEFTQKTALSKDELNRIYKYRNNKIIQWVFLLAVVLLLLVIMISYLTKEFMNSISVDIIWDILFVVLFIYIAILCMKNIRKLRNIKIDSLSVRRAVITEKQSVKSKDLIDLWLQKLMIMLPYMLCVLKKSMKERWLTSLLDYFLLLEMIL